MTPPDRSTGAVLVRSFLFFAAGFIVAFAVSYLVLGVWREGAGAPGESLLDNAAMAAYVLLVTAAPPAGAFAILTSPWPSWRNLRTSHVAWVSAAAGVAVYIGQLTGLSWALLFVPLPGGPIGAAIRLLLPGIAAGAAALVAARFLPAAPELREP